MTATDEIRRLLDERGVEWTDCGFPTTATEWCANGVVWHGLLRDGTIELVAMLTPKQAVEATLGSSNCTNDCTNSERTGTCRNVHEPPKSTTFWPCPHFKCSECGATHVSLDYVYYCPNCGAKVVDA